MGSGSIRAFSGLCSGEVFLSSHLHSGRFFALHSLRRRSVQKVVGTLQKARAYRHDRTLQVGRSCPGLYGQRPLVFFWRPLGRRRDMLVSFHRLDRGHGSRPAQDCHSISQQRPRRHLAGIHRFGLHRCEKGSCLGRLRASGSIFNAGKTIAEATGADMAFPLCA